MKDFDEDATQVTFASDVHVQKRDLTEAEVAQIAGGDDRYNGVQ